MYKNILIPIDGSENSRYALAQAVILGNEGGPEVRATVFHVNHATPINEYSVQMGPDVLGQEEGEAILKDADTVLAQARFPYEKQAIFGDPAREICDKAKAGHHDLIVMGNRGRSLVAELLLGSVSHKVLQNAHCAVLIVRR